MGKQLAAHERAAPLSKKRKKKWKKEKNESACIWIREKTELVAKSLRRREGREGLSLFLSIYLSPSLLGRGDQPTMLGVVNMLKGGGGVAASSPKQGNEISAWGFAGFRDEDEVSSHDSLELLNSKKSKKGKGKKREGKKKGTRGLPDSPPRPKRPTTTRVSLLERAGMSRTKEFVSKITERERQQKLAGVEDSARRSLHTPESNMGIAILSNITEETNELVRRIEQQKRKMSSQEESIQELLESLDRRREVLRKLNNQSKQTLMKRKADGTRKNAHLVKCDNLVLRINQSKAKERMFRKKVNAAREALLDGTRLEKELKKNHMELHAEKINSINNLKIFQQKQNAIREKMKQVRSQAEARLKDIKDEWHALGVFAEANTERERERVWKEKKDREVFLEAEEKKKKEEANNKLMNLSPFGMFDKSKNPTMQAIAAQHHIKEQREQNAKTQREKGGQPSGGAVEQMGGIAALLGAFGAVSKQSASGERRLSQRSGSFLLADGHRNSMDLSNVALAGNMTVNEEKEMKKSILADRWQMAKGHAQIQSITKQTQALENGFQVIREKTGIETPKVMVKTFLEKEEEIFRLFTHVNLLSEQIEEIEAQLESEREEIEKYRGKANESSVGRSILKQLDERLVRLEAKTRMHEAIGEKASTIIEKVKSSIASLFVRIGCDTKLIEDFCYSRGLGASLSAPCADGSATAAPTEGETKKAEQEGSKEQEEQQPVDPKDKIKAFLNNQEPEEGRKSDSSNKSESNGKERQESTANAIAGKSKTAQPINSPMSPNGGRKLPARASAARLTRGASSVGGSAANSPMNKLHKGSTAVWAMRGFKKGMKGFQAGEQVKYDDSAETSERELAITERNLLQYIGVIEQRVSEIRQIHCVVHKQKMSDGKHSKKPKPHALPTTNYDKEDWSDDDEGQIIRPLSHGELLDNVSRDKH